MQERRRYVRLNIHLEVKYTIEGEGPSQYTTITKNISPNGARFTLEKEIPKGTFLDLEIKIPAQSEPVKIKAKSIWSNKEIAPNGKVSYDSGIEFVQIPDESTTVFFQYLCNLMYDQLKSI